MIIVDNALEGEGSGRPPDPSGIVGAGFMCQGLTNQIVNSVPAMRVVAIYNRKVSRAVDVLRYAGRENVAIVAKPDESSTSDRARQDRQPKMRSAGALSHSRRLVE